MCEKYECRLSPDLVKKAVEELNEPEDTHQRLAAIDKLRARFEESVEDSCKTRTDDSFLLRFLRVRKFNEDAAFKTLQNYHSLRTKDWKELFDLADDRNSLVRLVESAPLVPLQNGRANDGTFVIIARPGKGFKERKDMLKFFAILICTLEYLLENEEFQIFGLTIVEDMSPFGLTTAFQMASYGKKFLHIIQEAMPVRVKSLNMVNEAIVFDAIYAIMSKFLKEKMKKRLQLHGSSYEKIHEVIDQSILPPFLDGTGPDLDSKWMVTDILGVETKDTEI